jgi:hypothetical protein
MNFEEIAYSILGWIVILVVLFIYTNKKRHPDRKPLSAFLVFFGIFFGAMMATLIVVVGAIYAFGQESSGIASSLGPILGLVVVIPVWRYAILKIHSPPNMKKTA